MHFRVAGCPEGQLKGFGHWFAVRRNGMHINDAFPQPIQADSLDHPGGMGGIGVGEDELPSLDDFQCSDRSLGDDLARSFKSGGNDIMVEVHRNSLPSEEQRSYERTRQQNPKQAAS